MRKKILLVFLVILVIIAGIVGAAFYFDLPIDTYLSRFFREKVPPHEMFAKAEDLRKSGYLLEAAEEYDALFDFYKDSELAPAALYYSGNCKYSLSINCPGKQEVAQKVGLSDLKRKQYDECIRYMEQQTSAFVYGEAIDKYIYTGHEFQVVLENYSASNLVDDAAFQLVRTRIVERQRTNTLTIEAAFQLYSDMFELYPQSPYRQKGIEDLLQLLSEHHDVLVNPDSVATLYQKIVQFTENVSERAKLSYLLGKKFLEQEDTQHAAIVLDVPSIIGIGIVATQRTGLNIRSGPGLNHGRVAQAEKGEEVLLLEQANPQWYHVQLQGGTLGYASSEFIQVKTP